MVPARGLALVVVMIAGAGDALAQPKAATPPLVGVSEVVKVTTPKGFIDDVVAAEGDRVAYVVTEAAKTSELHVLSLSTKQEQVIDLSEVTLHPVALRLVGARAFVVGRLADGKHVAALVELTARAKSRPAGTVVYKLEPADHVTVITHKGKPRVAVHRTTATTIGTRHDVELVALETGRRVGRRRSLELDGAGASKKLDFRVNHWSAGWTRAHGIKAGAWDRKENQRSPDVEGIYDFTSGKLATTKITDLFEQKRRFQALVGASGLGDFVRASADRKSLELWRDAKLHAIALDQPLANYDQASLQGVIQPDGSAWIVLEVDPVNPAAVARKKADPEYLDVFRVTADGKATRKARVLAPGARHWFGVFGDKFWLIERNKGFERGGKRLTVYQPR